MATDANRFIALGMPPILAQEVAKAIDAASGGQPTITVTLTGAVTGTGAGTTDISIETTATP